jgi:hypothetical protein
MKAHQVFPFMFFVSKGEAGCFGKRPRLKQAIAAERAASSSATWRGRRRPPADGEPLRLRRTRAVACSAPDQSAKPAHA